MNPQKQITTNAPSIRYEGDLRAEQAGIMQLVAEKSKHDREIKALRDDILRMARI